MEAQAVALTHFTKKNPVYNITKYTFRHNGYYLAMCILDIDTNSSVSRSSETDGWLVRQNHLIFDFWPGKSYKHPSLEALRNSMVQ